MKFTITETCERCETNIRVDIETGNGNVYVTPVLTEWRKVHAHNIPLDQREITFPRDKQRKWYMEIQRFDVNGCRYGDVIYADTTTEQEMWNVIRQAGEDASRLSIMARRL